MGKLTHWSESYKSMDARIPTELIKIRKSVTFGGVFFLAKSVSFSEKIFESYVREKFLPISKDLWGGIREYNNVVLRVGVTFDKTVAFEIRGPWGVIFDILCDKKDSLLISKNKLNLERYKRPITHVSRKGFVRVTDEAAGPLNSHLNFASVTKALCIREMVIDADRLLSFKYNMDEVSNSLTALLIGDLLNGAGARVSS